MYCCQTPQLYAVQRGGSAVIQVGSVTGVDGVDYGYNSEPPVYNFIRGVIGNIVLHDISGRRDLKQVSRFVRAVNFFFGDDGRH